MTDTINPNNSLVNRRRFIHTTLAASLGLTLAQPSVGLGHHDASVASGKRVGIIGLDTSHSSVFTKLLNDPKALPELGGYRVVAAYPQGSRDIVSSVSMIAGYTEEVKKYGVEIVDSIGDLLAKVDVVLLETNDGRLHLEQVLPVFKAGKRVFIDKPIAASLSDTKAIFAAADQYHVPVFSSSALRFEEHVQQVVQGNIGAVTGADVYSPATLEKTHPDLFWYGIHGVEMLFAVMGTGCKSVTRTFNGEVDLVVGVWNDNRIGTFRGIRKGVTGFGGTAYGEKGIITLGPFTGYQPLVREIVQFFDTGKPPVPATETLEMVAFMEAADASKRHRGKTVRL
ncbi:Gfo/Idh/MocA family oxidoreductase [Spirosoma aureum]|uniref:Gfo/Idh/MocA family oxidoreductase n=1 Tax=Spirosoma aureum TaxID=2692134 RepID=A0A6G9AXE5_9BACT|nr:Gfo/Idh/MocA family oxidoreductase [Spirosoma aureum]QIP17009.1 Gfo/Idh/MocA family oxidoreductase [Spirosoma aureum]